MSDWQQQAKGWWTNDKIKAGVCLEADNRWHSYVSDKESPDNTPSFRTMKLAMADAEKRAMK